MKVIRYALLCLFTVLITDVYASTRITDQNEIVSGEIPKRAHIWVYDFFATASDIPAESALAVPYATCSDAKGVHFLYCLSWSQLLFS